MIIGAVQCECIIHDAHSLKEKRAVLTACTNTAQTKIQYFRCRNRLSRPMATGSNCNSSCVVFTKGD